MNFETLFSGLNRRDERNFGKLVTKDVFDYWVEQDIVPGPARVPRSDKLGDKAPNFEWSKASLRNAIAARKLKAIGLERSSAIRAQLWLLGYDIPLAVVTGDIETEFLRLQSRARRPITSTYDPRTGADLSERAAGILNKQMGPLSPTIVPDGFKWPIDGMIGAYAMLVFGEASTTFKLLARTLLEGVAPSVASDSLIDSITDFLSTGFSGILGAEDEIDNSANEELATIVSTTYEDARRILNQIPWLITHGLDFVQELVELEGADLERYRIPNKNIASALMQFEFRLVIFVMLLMTLTRTKETELEIREEFEPAILTIRGVFSAIKGDLVLLKSLNNNPFHAFLLLMNSSGKLKDSEHILKRVLIRKLWNKGLKELTILGRDALAHLANGQEIPGELTDNGRIRFKRRT